MDAQTPIDYPSVSCEDLCGGSTASTLSLFSVSAYANQRDTIISNKTDDRKTTGGKKRFHGLVSVKNATKCAAKKINSILVKAKSKIMKSQATKELTNVSILSTSTTLTDVDLYDDDEEVNDFADVHEFDRMNFNTVSRFSSCDTLLLADNQYTEQQQQQQQQKQYTLTDSRDPNSSFQSETSSTNSSLIHQIFAESIADLNIICARNEKAITIPKKEKKLFRKGTPYKLKMPPRLTLYDDDWRNLSQDNGEIHPNQIVSIEDQCNSSLNSTNYGILQDVDDNFGSKCDRTLHIDYSSRIQESFAKRIARNFCQIERMLSNLNFFYRF